ncbi:hypothetical protein RRG08_041483 [Elysia crispata]|uniref:Uncharacterized protein n=1 Tax=Elysia crispata TaxID=231223 RepID=A0AAE1CRE2_9GAST|nr:hypothetical protein RRG08_041483 [Elysia crispata]
MWDAKSFGENEISRPETYGPASGRKINGFQGAVTHHTYYRFDRDRYMSQEQIYISSCLLTLTSSMLSIIARDIAIPSDLYTIFEARAKKCASPTEIPSLKTSSECCSVQEAHGARLDQFKIREPVARRQSDKSKVRQGERARDYQAVIKGG